jgi:hypothetical protein
LSNLGNPANPLRLAAAIPITKWRFYVQWTRKMGGFMVVIGNDSKLSNEPRWCLKEYIACNWEEQTEMNKVITERLLQWIKDSDFLLLYCSPSSQHDFTSFSISWDKEKDAQLVV